MSTIGFQSLCQRALLSVTAKQSAKLQQDCRTEAVSQSTDIGATNPQTATNWRLAIAGVQRGRFQTVQPNLFGADTSSDYYWAWFNRERGQFVFLQPHCA